jgi:hypothetical protein
LVEELIEKFGNLTILVPIIAKQIIASKISIENFAVAVEDDAFARFDNENEDIRIRKDGKSQRTNSLDFIRAMFNIAGLSDKHRLVLRYLTLLKEHRCLTIKEYRRLTGENNIDILNDLQYRNWISYVNADKDEDAEIKVHQLIYDLRHTMDAAGVGEHHVQSLQAGFNQVGLFGADQGGDEILVVSGVIELAEGSLDLDDFQLVLFQSGLYLNLQFLPGGFCHGGGNFAGGFAAAGEQRDGQHSGK